MHKIKIFLEFFHSFLISFYFLKILSIISQKLSIISQKTSRLSKYIYSYLKVAKTNTPCLETPPNCFPFCLSRENLICIHSDLLIFEIVANCSLQFGNSNLAKPLIFSSKFPLCSHSVGITQRPKPLPININFHENRREIITIF